MVPEIAGGFGMRAAPGPHGALALGEALSRALAEPTLLVLDSFERVVEAAPEITTLLARVEPLKVLVTSQAALRLYGERELAIAPLAVPDPRHLPPLAELGQSPAVALFVERASGALPGFALTPDNAAAVAAICARLDGLPLAIELAAARVKLLSPAALAARLAKSLDFLTGPRDLPARQQTLRATIDWSHELLSPAEQALFRRLSVFASGCTLEAAEAVADARQDLGQDVLEAMSSLVDKSLLRCRDATVEDPRFEMLDIVREYALERLAKSADEEVARRAHAAYALVLAEEGAQALSGPESAATLARFDQELPNLRAALDYLVAEAPRRVRDAARDRAPAVLAPPRAPLRGTRAFHGRAGARGRLAQGPRRGALRREPAERRAGRRRRHAADARGGDGALPPARRRARGARDAELARGRLPADGRSAARRAPTSRRCCRRRASARTRATSPTPSTTWRA